MKIGLAAAHFHSVGVARAGPWNTRVNRGGVFRLDLENGCGDSCGVPLVGSTVDRSPSSRAQRVTIARHCLSLFTHRSTTFRAAYSSLSKLGFLPECSARFSPGRCTL